MPYEPPPEIASLSIEQIGELIAARKLPPVDSWNPERVGDSEMCIAHDGTWYHQGSVIRRPAMVRAFASVLRREPDGQHVLITPYEKLSIDVEDSAFIAIDVTSRRTGRERILAFRTNTDELVMAGQENPLTIEEKDGEPSPYIAVRGGMRARLSRSVFYALADMAIAEQESEPAQQLGLWSCGVFFAFKAEV